MAEHVSIGGVRSEWYTYEKDVRCRVKGASSRSMASRKSARKIRFNAEPLQSLTLFPIRKELTSN